MTPPILALIVSESCVDFLVMDGRGLRALRAAGYAASTGAAVASAADSEKPTWPHTDVGPEMGDGLWGRLAQYDDVLLGKKQVAARDIVIVSFGCITHESHLELPNRKNVCWAKRK